ncbi:MAG TPA: TolC family protein [Candidatus Eisenbacteria bacterium]|nr:TolC family protein [Candidatus Eisenbacteria bacterium]
MLPFRIRTSILSALLAVALAGVAGAFGAPGPLGARRALAADAAPAPLTLGEVLRDVSESNPTLAAKRAMAAAAEERHRSTGAWEPPMLEFGVVNLPTSWDFNEDDMTMKMIGVVQRVPLFGAKKYRNRAAGDEAEAAGSASAGAHLELFGAAIEAYADAYYAIERAREAARHESVMARFVESAMARYRSGNGRLDDVLRAQAEQARVRAEGAGFQADAERALARLGALRGRRFEGGFPALAPPPPLPVPADPSTWIAAAADDHPRVMEAEARERGYEMSAQASKKMAWPDLEVRASYGQRGKDAMGMELNDMVTATVGVTIPLGYGSREGAMAKEMSAMARAASAEKEEAALDLARMASTLHSEALASSRMVALLADTVVTTQARAVEASWSAYSSGSIDLWRVFEANHALYTDDLALLDARRMLARAQGELVALTGRGDLAGVELPVIRRDEQ